MYIWHCISFRCKHNDHLHNMYVNKMVTVKFNKHPHRIVNGFFFYENF